MDRKIDDVSFYLEKPCYKIPLQQKCRGAISIMNFKNLNNVCLFVTMSFIIWGISILLLVMFQCITCNISCHASSGWNLRDQSIHVFFLFFYLKSKLCVRHCILLAAIQIHPCLFRLRLDLLLINLDMDICKDKVPRPDCFSVGGHKPKIL